MGLNLYAIEAYLHEHIPITRAMGLKVTDYDGDSVRLWAPLEPNLNHRQTAFGGSVSTLGILAGWTLLHIKLQESGAAAQLVIQHSETDYTAPVDSDFMATCVLPDGREWATFLRAFGRYGKARIRLESRIGSGDRLLARHTGSYVAIRRDAA